jgi:hypothetical protein
MLHFNYPSLDTSRRETRLVYPIEDNFSNVDQINTPAAEELSVRYILKVASLDEVPLYTALSYCWGTTEDKKQITLNEETFMVTQNLATALQYLRREGRPEGLWIDSICINQDDKDEKTEQVQQMKSIYESANEVVVWLGPAADNSDIIMDLLAEIGKQACEYGLPEKSLPFHRRWPEPQKDERLQALMKIFSQFIDRVGYIALAEAFGSFVARDWWKRVWVTQELAVAKNPIFGLGNKRVPYAYVYAAVDFWASESIQTLLSKYRSDNLFQVANDKVFNSLAYKSVYPATAMLSHPRWYRGESRNKTRTLYSLLLRALISGDDGFRLLATCEEDYVYGLLGLAEDIAALDIRPDYSIKWQNVYTDVTRKLIKAGHVDILALCQKKTFNLLDKMPSWVPDWRAGIEGQIQEPFVAIGAAIAQPFSASGKNLPNAELRDRLCQISDDIPADKFLTHDLALGDKLPKITLSGAYLDLVEEIGTAYGPVTEPGEDTLGIMSRFFLEIDCFCRKSAALNCRIYNSSERRKEALWRVPIRDIESSLSRSGMNLPSRATKLSRARYHKFRYLTKAYECFNKLNPSPTPSIRNMPQPSKRKWPSLPLRLLKFIWVVQSVYFIAIFFLSRANWLAKCTWWLRSRVLLARSWFLGSADARNSLREKINSEWDAVLSEKPDAYALTMNAAYKRRPFLTSRGYVGLGPEHLLEGDVICVLYGGTVPFMLRPKEKEMGGYYVVGEAYVDGIMDGEYMDTNPKIEKFVLC